MEKGGCTVVFGVSELDWAWLSDDCLVLEGSSGGWEVVVETGAEDVETGAEVWGGTDEEVSGGGAEVSGGGTDEDVSAGASVEVGATD